MAAHLAQDSNEIRAILTIFQTRSQAHKRLTDAILADEGFVPEEFDSYQLKTEGQDTYMVPQRQQVQQMTLPSMPPDKPAANGSATAAEQLANRL